MSPALNNEIQTCLYKTTYHKPMITCVRVATNGVSYCHDKILIAVSFLTSSCIQSNSAWDFKNSLFESTNVRHKHQRKMKFGAQLTFGSQLASKRGGGSKYGHEFNSSTFAEKLKIHPNSH